MPAEPGRCADTGPSFKLTEPNQAPIVLRERTAETEQKRVLDWQDPAWVMKLGDEEEEENPDRVLRLLEKTFASVPPNTKCTWPPWLKEPHAKQRANPSQAPAKALSHPGQKQGSTISSSEKSTNTCTTSAEAPPSRNEHRDMLEFHESVATDEEADCKNRKLVKEEVERRDNAWDKFRCATEESRHTNAAGSAPILMRNKQGKTTLQTLLDTWIPSKPSAGPQASLEEAAIQVSQANTGSPAAILTTLTPSHTLSNQCHRHPCAEFPVLIPLQKILQFIQKARQNPKGFSRLTDPLNLDDLISMMGGWEELNKGTFGTLCHALTPNEGKEKDFVLPWMQQVKDHVSLSSLQELLTLTMPNHPKASQPRFS